MSVSLIFSHPRTGIEDDIQRRVSQVAVSEGMTSWPWLLMNVNSGMIRGALDM